MRKYILFFLIIVLVILGIYHGNTSVQTTYYTVELERLPEGFHSFRIVQLSDIHDSQFGENHSLLVSKVKAIQPDMIFVTGDFVDRNRYNLDQSLALIEQIHEIAPIYYVTGNHEIATNDVNYIKHSLERVGVHVLSDESVEIGLTVDEKIVIGGVDDPLGSYMDAEEKFVINTSIERAFHSYPENQLKILLSHRPEYFELYAQHAIDLTFSGHAHGGQFRIPGVGGLVSPGQGFFPKYTSGVHEMNGSQLVVSRGLGNSIIPIRIFNRPEIVVVTLIPK